MLAARVGIGMAKRGDERMVERRAFLKKATFAGALAAAIGEARRGVTRSALE